MNFLPLSEEEEYIGKAIIKASFKIHKSLGPGLLEKVYESCLNYELLKENFCVQRQVFVPIIYDGLVFNEGLRLDLLINDLVIVEIKAQETINSVWQAQIISHLKLTNKRLGYLINFDVSFIKSGIRRFIV
jgi:GxxExxY protein